MMAVYYVFERFPFLTYFCIRSFGKSFSILVLWFASLRANQRFSSAFANTLKYSPMSSIFPFRILESLICPLPFPSKKERKRANRSLKRKTVYEMAGKRSSNAGNCVVWYILLTVALGALYITLAVFW